MNISNYANIAVVAVICAACVSFGCEGDEFDDAEFATASGQGSEYQAGAGPEETSYGDDGRAADSPGPVRGSERPADHPTLRGEGEGNSAGQQQGGAMDAPAPDVARPQPDEYGEVGPMLWEAPSDWRPQSPSNQMRFAQYDVPGAGDFSELAVFYFGPGGGGGAEATINRWAGEFSDGPDAERDQIEVEGMTVDTVEASGTREATMAVGDGGPEENQRLLGAVAHASQGLFFFRLVGDDEAVSDQREAFQTFVQSFEDGGR